MITAQPQRISACAAELGEGPVWDPRDGTLWWVDILAPALFQLRDGDTTRFEPPFQVTALAPAAAGGFVAATARGPALIDPAAGYYQPLGTHEPAPGTRTNDGKLDRTGGFWFGTMDASGANAPVGILHHVRADGHVTAISTGYHVTNGPAFSNDGRTMYHNDSALGRIHAYDLAPGGAATGRRVHATLTDGAPDGMTVDAEGALWVAVWDGGCIRRLAPDGTLLTEIAMPVRRPTSVAFGGPDLRTLHVTSARFGTGDSPGAGDLYALTPGVAGLPDTPFEYRP